MLKWKLIFWDYVSEIVEKLKKIINKKNSYIFFVFLIFTTLGLENFAKENAFSSEKLDQDISFANPKNETDYLLGPGDKIFLLTRLLPEYSGSLQIMPDGYVLLPGIYEKVSLNALTLEEAREKILLKFSKYLKSPNISIFITSYRPITVYVKGEVVKPGLYSFKGSKSLQDQEIFESLNLDQINESIVNPFPKEELKASGGYTSYGFPTVYDALKASQGITPYSDISSIKIIRQNKLSDGGGKIMTNLNFVSLFKEGDLSQNIRIFDQDVISINKSEVILTEQLVEANNSNLSPDFLPVLITGNVVNPGRVIVPRGAGLNQAISMVGGEKLLSGNVEFLRYDAKGIIEKRSFSLNPSAKLDSYQNPILVRGDVINIDRSLFGKSSDLIKEVVSPIVNSYTLYKIFTD